jgi:hypothetical protein
MAPTVVKAGGGPWAQPLDLEAEFIECPGEDDPAGNQLKQSLLGSQLFFRALQVFVIGVDSAPAGNQARAVAEGP